MKAVSLKNKCAIVGIGDTAYTRGTDKSALQLQLDASMTAIADAGLTPKDIDGFLPFHGSGVIAEQFWINLGNHELNYSSATQQGGASVVASVQTAAMAVLTGAANYVLLAAGRPSFTSMRVSMRAGSRPQNEIVNEFEKPYGAGVPVQWFSMAARRHMYEFGTTSRQFGALAVNNRKMANLNPRAVMYGKPMTIEDHQKSPMVADPLRLFDCSLETDGAAAFIVTTMERARALKKKPAIIMGVAQGHPDAPTSVTHKPVMTEISGVKRAARKAFAMAGITPQDVRVAEIYDCFTYILLCALEDIGFCKKGEGGPFAESGRIGLDGDLSLNTHGGLLSEAHTSGMNHIIEGVRQIRGEAEAHQSKKADIVLVSGFGDHFDGSVMLLRR